MRSWVEVFERDAMLDDGVQTMLVQGCWFREDDAMTRRWMRTLMDRQ